MSQSRESPCICVVRSAPVLLWNVYRWMTAKLRSHVSTAGFGRPWSSKMHLRSWWLCVCEGRLPNYYWMIKLKGCESNCWCSSFWHCAELVTTAAAATTTTTTKEKEASVRVVCVFFRLRTGYLLNKSKTSDHFLGLMKFLRAGKRWDMHRGKSFEIFRGSRSKSSVPADIILSIKTSQLIMLK